MTLPRRISFFKSGKVRFVARKMTLSVRAVRHLCAYPLRLVPPVRRSVGASGENGAAGRLLVRLITLLPQSINFLKRLATFLPRLVRFLKRNVRLPVRVSGSSVRVADD